MRRSPGAAPLLLAVASCLVLATLASAAGAWPLSSSGPRAPDPSSPPELAAPRGASRLRAFGDADGLHNLVIVGITQDARGALWVGTDAGVYRYDGERFTLFGLSHGLPSTSLTVIGLTPDGEACSGSKQGLVCWDGARFSGAAAAGLPRTAIHAIVTEGDRMWVGTGLGLYVRERARPFAPAPGWPTDLPSPVVDSLWADDRGVLAGCGGMVLERDGDGRWRPLDRIGLAGDRVDGVLRDRQGGLWIRTVLHLWHLAPGAERAVDLGEGLPTAFDSADAAVNMILGPRGEVWIGSDSGIAYRAGGRWRLLGRDEGFPGTRTLFVDREGTTWMGANGLFRWRGRGLIERFDTDNGLPGKIAWSFGRDRHGQLWVGTDQCLARMLDGAWRCHPGSEGRTVRSFAFPPQGGVFLGGLPAELLYIDPLGAVTKLGRELSAVEDQKIQSMVLGGEGDLWIGTRNGLFRMRGAAPGPLEQIEVPGVSNRATFATVIADGPRLWAASMEGLVLIERGDPRTARVFGTRDGLRANTTRYLTGLRDREICVAYSEAIGFSCLGFDGERLSNLRHHDSSSGLTSAKVYFLGEDRWRRLWVGTGDGLDVITPRGVEHFAERDGLAGNDSAANAFLADTDGTLWTGAVGGASHVLAPQYEGPPPPPRTVLHRGRLGDQRLPAGLTLAGPRETSHDHSALAIDFGADSLADPDRVQFQVRLSPADQGWSTTEQRLARYPRLLAGAYRLEVRARVDQRPWGAPLVLDFVVRPAWWQTRWFLALLGAALLGAIAGLFSWRQRAILRKRTRQLDEQAAVWLRELLDSVPDFIIVHRAEQVIYLNQAARAWFGIDVSPDAASRLRARFAADDLAKIDQMIRCSRELDANRTPEMLEVGARGADASWRTLEMTSVRLNFGGISANVVAARDVSERRRLRDKLVVSDRMASLGTLAAGIAHEINNPLAYLIGNLQLVAETLREADDPDVISALADASDGAERVRKIVSSLRVFSRGEEEQRLTLDVRGALEAALRLTAHEIRHRAQLVTELGPVPQIVADDGRLTQVFLNLLVNAAHAIAAGQPDANRIIARTFTDAQGRAVVEIADTGAGMTPEVLARAFDPFFTTKDIGEGTGLGLSICHGIIEGLGGRISLDSAPGQGTTVRVVIPASTSEPRSQVRRVAAASGVSLGGGGADLVGGGSDGGDGAHRPRVFPMPRS